ncbi:MAG: biotin--[acetyl-CoA-carboxylase] ligase [Faecalicoccus sp.]|nr:biotin--[acetyl-CoA-carboxylase] ligase [Faecalicoccus sp.]
MKSTLFSVFNNHKNHFFTLDDLAEGLHWSHQAIYDEVDRIRHMGYNIEFDEKKGFRMMDRADEISMKTLSKQLDPIYTVEIVDEVTSTNSVLRYRANTLEHGHVLIAETETAAHGKQKTKVFCPKNGGIYLSICLKPKFGLNVISKLSSAAAAAAAKAIELNYGIHPEIRWLDDLYFNNQKIGNFVVESGVKLNPMELDYVLVGIIINVHSTTFPEDMPNCSSIEDLTHSIVNRNQLIIDILNTFAHHIRHILGNNFFKYYMSYSDMVGKNVTLRWMNQEFTGTVQGIDEDLSLVVSNGEETVRASCMEAVATINE